MHKTTLIASLLLLSISVCAQKLAVKKVELAGEKIIVHYDLDDSNPNNEYQINLFASTNNYGTPMAKVTGDVGNEITHGLNKKIIWNIKEELGPYKGKLAVEVRGRVFVPVAKLTGLSTRSKFKRGKTHTIAWKPGSTNPIHIELMKGGQRVSGELNQPNNGSFSMFIPEHASIGSDYTIRITDARNSEDVVNSQPFAVSRKIPLLLKVVPVAAVGGLIVVLAGGSGGGGGGGGGSTTIPNPPGTPDGDN
jgi:hypothetical protein